MSPARTRDRTAQRESIAALECEAREHPGRYRLRVIGLVVLGHLFVFLWVAVALGLAGGILWAQFAAGRFFVATLKLELLLLGAVWLMLRALWVRIEPPGGREISREEAPELFALVDRHARALRAPIPNRVLVDDQFNASVAQTPRWGLFGGWRNDLVLGLPLMQALDREEFSAVLAHEFGHLSASHGRFGAWTYRVRIGWMRIGEAFAGRSGTSAMLRPFFEWYLPRLDATTFALARRQEYEADRAAAECTSPRAIGSALVRLSVVSRWMQENFWPELVATARDVDRPPARHDEWPRRLAVGLRPAAARQWLQQALAFRSDVHDTHPSLADRLAALGETPGEPPVGLPAEPAEGLLGPLGPRLREELNMSWRDAAGDAWHERHEELAARAAEVTKLRERAGREPLDEAEQWALVESVEHLEGEAAAEPLASAFVAAHPDHAEARLLLGVVLLRREAEEGLRHLERATALEARMILPASTVAAEWLRERGRTDEAEAWEERGRERGEVLALAGEERRELPPAAVFEPSDVDDALRGALISGLADIEEIQSAWLVRRRVEHVPEVPAWVLVVRPSPGLLGFVGNDRARKVVDLALERLPLPDGTLVVATQGTLAWTREKAAAVPGAELK